MNSNKRLEEELIQLREAFA